MKERSPDVSEMLRFVYGLLDIQGASNILDIGCGDGYDLFQMARLASPSCRFWGIDASSRAIQVATSEANGDPRFIITCHDASQRLPFRSGQFDIVFSKNTLECISKKSALIDETHRVLRGEGQVVFAHFDWDSQVISGKNKPLIRKIVHAFADWKQDWMHDCDAWMGRRLWGEFNGSGLFKGQLHTYVLTNTDFCPPYYGYERIKDFSALVEKGFVTEDEIKDFYDDIQEQSTQGKYFYSITLYIYVGRKLAV